MDSTLALDTLSLSLSVAFIFGLFARLVGMPPMIGFLVAGFVLSAFGVEATETGQRIADVGVLLLLFTIGLKISPAMLAERQVLGGALGHLLVFSAVLWGLLMMLATQGVAMIGGLGPQEAALIAFALSFSSTVFAVKTLEERGEIGSVHGRLALGILIIQDIAAVVFLTAVGGEVPSVWAVALLGLLALPWCFRQLLKRIGRDELLPLFGLCAVLVLGAASFKAVGLKPDLGALIMGMLMARQKRAGEVADALLGFKDIFLIGFFLNIGLGGLPSPETVLAALALTALLLIKLGLFFVILVLLRLRARTALLTSLALATYSEFGLIVGQLAVEEGLMPEEWLTLLALAVALSFLVATPANAAAHRLYELYNRRLRTLQADRDARTDRRPDIEEADLVIFGMGRLGSAAYRALAARSVGRVVGIETDVNKVERLRAEGWNVVHGDASDPDFWRYAVHDHAEIRAVLIAMPDHDAAMYALARIQSSGFNGLVAVLVRFPDQIPELRNAGADMVFDVYGEAGAGFAGDIARRLEALHSRGAKPAAEATGAR